MNAEAFVVAAFLRAVDRQGLPAPTEAAHRWLQGDGLVRELNEGMKAMSTGRAFPWPPVDLQPLFALAQHHGIPTRLLDWTERPHVAAYFAAVKAAQRVQSEDRSGHLAVWAISPGLVWELLASPVEKPVRPNFAYLRAPRATNLNLHAQAGVFTLITDVMRTLDEPGALPPLNILIEERHRDSDPRWRSRYPLARRLELPVEEAGKLLRLLSYDRIGATDVYPGLDGVARDA